MTPGRIFLASWAGVRVHKPVNFAAQTRKNQNYQVLLTPNTREVRTQPWVRDPTLARDPALRSPRRSRPSSSVLRPCPSSLFVFSSSVELQDPTLTNLHVPVSLLRAGPYTLPNSWAVSLARDSDEGLCTVLRSHASRLID